MPLAGNAEPKDQTDTSALPADSAWHGRIWRLAGPIILANISTPLLGAVDTAVVGHLGDASYIGGVAVGAMIFSFLFWGFGFLRMSTTGFTAQAHGARDWLEVRANLVRPLTIALVLGSLLILLQLPIAWVSFWAVGASEAVTAQATIYFDYRIWASPAALVNYCILGWLLGTQRVTATLVLQLLLNGLNIALDFFFVMGLGWGVDGVAIATVIAEVTVAVAGLCYILRCLRRYPAQSKWRDYWQWDKTWALFKVNADIFIRTLSLIFAFSYFTVLGARLGDDILAANAILLHFLSMASYGLDGFAHAAEILTGSAIGARRRAAFHRAVRVSILWALVLASVLAAIYWLLGSSIISLFTNLPQVAASAETYLPWLIASPLVSIWSYQLDGIFIGATRTHALRNSTVLAAATFCLAAWILMPLLGNHGLWLALTIFMAARALFLAAYFPALARSVAKR